MPDYTVDIKTSARRALDSLPRPVRERIARAITRLANDPRPPRCKQLTATSPVLYRVPVGSYRVVYEIRDRELLVMVVKVAKRARVYDDL